MIVDRCKGSRDFGPEEMARFRLVEDTFRDSCEAWGFREVKTPTLEYLHLFTSTGTLTPGMLEKVYSFLDWDGWSGERVVLRPDNTIPVARLYIDCLAAQGPARLFYVNNTFIFEPTGKANRERWQCGAEFIGGAGSPADVELITLAIETLYQLGIEDIDLRLSHAGLIRAILKKAELPAEDEVKVFDEIIEGNADTLARLKSEKPELAQVVSLLLQIKGKAPGALKNLKAVINSDFPEIQTALDDFIAITGLLDGLGLEYQIDITSGRGFEYYTGVMFQLFANREKVGGGGRYDDLIPLMGGEETPASGFALYMDPLMALLSTTEPNEKDEPHIGMLVGPGEEKTAFDTAEALRDEGYIVEFCYDATAAEKVPWLVTVEENDSSCMLTDTATATSYEAGDVDELLEVIEEQIRD
jgi:histidyl-tRNA synthetase